MHRSPKTARALRKKEVKLQFAAVQAMPLVGAIVRERHSAKPIVVYEKADPTRLKYLTLRSFLSLNVLALERGGTLADLLNAKRRPAAPRWDMEPLALDDVEEIVTASDLSTSIKDSSA